MTMDLTPAERAQWREDADEGLYLHPDDTRSLLDALDAAEAREQAILAAPFRCQTHMCGECGGCKAAKVRHLLAETSERAQRAEAERDELRAAIAPDGVDGHPCIRVEAYMAAMDRARDAEAERDRARSYSDADTETASQMASRALAAEVERDSVQLALDGIRGVHARDNEYLINRAEAAEAERDRLREQVTAVRELADEWGGRPYGEQMIPASVLRAALAGEAGR